MSKHKDNPNILPTTPNSNQAATPTRDSREDKFLDLLFIAKSVRQAGIMAGYSEDYCKVSIYNKFKSAPFQQKLIQRYKSNAYSDLPLIQSISKRGLQRILEDLENGSGDLASKLKHIPRQTLEILKLLAPEGANQTIQMVNVENMQTLIVNKVQQSEQDEDK